MLVLIATLTAKPGQETALETLLRAMVPKVRSEQGTLEYTLHQSAEQQGRFLFYEKYADRAAFDRHCATPYFKELMAAVSPLLGGAPTMDFSEVLVSARD